MLSINTHEAKTRFSELLARVERERETVILCLHGRPVAKLVPWPKPKDPFRPSPSLGKVVFHEDPVRPLDEEEWLAEARHPS